MAKRQKGIIYRENEKRLARIIRDQEIKNRRLRFAVKLFGRTIIKIFDNKILDRLPEETKTIIRPLINEMIEQL